MTRMELRCKGIDNELIEGIVGEIDDNENAYRAALIKARWLSPSDYRLFRRRLGEHLRRKGFGYDVIKETIARIWQECGNKPV